ncbi:hypothetical protein B8V81_0869 [Paenibacillus pasadenensis]|uniref:Uncharacterized protein n=1 Tax=Paenibacillus pasadenensis TaxID=217090 RepID=A0A2N5N8J4_9BACL|nr:hypothetical protein B8V81_0869 [Paenibacillus pasadenensis]
MIASKREQIKSTVGLQPRRARACLPTRSRASIAVFSPLAARFLQ